MRFRLRADVIGGVYSFADFCFRAEDLCFEVLTEGSGRIKEIAVSVPVEPERFASRIVHNPGTGADAEIHLGGDPEVISRLMRALQDFESHASFTTGASLERVTWQAPTQELVPETREEQELTQILSWKSTLEARPRRARVRPDVVVGIAMAALRLNHLTLLKAFWREGCNDLAVFRFVDAFSGFFYVLEGIYAPGLSGERAVLRAFLNSHLPRMLADALAQFRKSQSRLYTALAAQAKGFGCDLGDPDQAVRFLVRIRGQVHHFNPDSPKVQRTPFTQDQFEAVAVLADTLAYMAIGFLEVAANERSRLEDGPAST